MKDRENKDGVEWRRWGEKKRKKKDLKEWGKMRWKFWFLRWGNSGCWILEKRR